MSGAGHDTSIEVPVAFDATALVTRAGIVTMTVAKGLDEFDHTPAYPTALRTATWNTYDVPGVNPVTVAEVPAGLPVTDV